MAVVWPSKNNFANGDVLTATNMNNIADTLNVFNPTSATNGQIWIANGSGSGSYQTPTSASYTSIQSGNLGATINITGIPGTYRDLVLIFRDAECGGASMSWNIRLNNDSGNNYDYVNTASYNAQYLNGGGQTQAQWLINAMSVVQTNTNGVIMLRISDYANSTTNKICHAAVGYKNSAGTYEAENFVGYYRSSTAITQVNIIPGTNNFNGGTYVLWGVS